MHCPAFCPIRSLMCQEVAVCSPAVSNPVVVKQVGNLLLSAQPVVRAVVELLLAAWLRTLMQAISLPGHVIVQPPFAEDVGHTVWAARRTQVVYGCTNHQQAIVLGAAGGLPSSEQCQPTRWRKNSTLHASEIEWSASKVADRHVQTRAEGRSNTGLT